MLGWNEQWVVLLWHRCSITFPRLPDLTRPLWQACRKSLAAVVFGRGRGGPAVQGFRPVGVQGTGQAMDRASWALGQGLVHRCFCCPGGTWGPGLGRERVG